MYTGKERGGKKERKMRDVIVIRTSEVLSKVCDVSQLMTTPPPRDLSLRSTRLITMPFLKLRQRNEPRCVRFNLR